MSDIVFGGSCPHGYSSADVPEVCPDCNPPRGSKRWRTGRTLGRTLYCDGCVVGIVDTPELASELCNAANGCDQLAVAVVMAAIRYQHANTHYDHDDTVSSGIGIQIAGEALRDRIDAWQNQRTSQVTGPKGGT